jgi:hypothetical protein
MDKPLVNKKYKIEKFQGKGGWHFVIIKGIPKSNRGKNGIVRVSGTIDTYKVTKYNLMPVKNGDLFLPIKTEIRKKLNKKEGDSIQIILFEDTSPLEIPAELIMCFKDEPIAFKTFHGLSDAEQKQYLDWIYSAKKEETKIDRIAKTINKLLNGEKLYSAMQTLKRN